MGFAFLTEHRGVDWGRLEGHRAVACPVITVLLGASPHHSLVWVLQQEAHRHEGDTLLLVDEDGHPATATLVHGPALGPEHARDAGATQVHVKDPHLQDDQAVAGSPEAGRNELAAPCVHLQGAGASEGAGGVVGARGTHFLARVAQGEGQLCGDSAFPNPALSREDEDDVLDAGQVSRLCSEG